MAWRMREADRREISSIMTTLQVGKFAEQFAALSKYGFVVSIGKPVAIFGINEVWPGRFEAMMIATDQWPQAALTTAKEIRRKLLPQIKSLGFKLGFCFVNAENAAASRWAVHLGFKEQTEIAGWGKNNEGVKLMIWRP